MKLECVYHAGNWWLGMCLGQIHSANVSIIVYRRLSHLGSLEKNGLVVLYNKLRAAMIDSEDRKPTFTDVAKAIWYDPCS